MNKVMVIKSSKWYRAQYRARVYKDRDRYESSLLYNKKRGSCCIGIHAIFYGISKKDLENISTPVELLEAKGPLFLEKHQEYFDIWCSKRSDHTTMAKEAFNINDDTTTTDEQKINLLRLLFDQIEVKIDWRPNE